MRIITLLKTGKLRNQKSGCSRIERLCRYVKHLYKVFKLEMPASVWVFRENDWSRGKAALYDKLFRSEKVSEELSLHASIPRFP